MPPKPKKKPVHPEKKSPVSVKGSARDAVIDAALVLAGRQGWEMTTLRDIADEADIELADLYDMFDDRSDIIAAYGKRLDRHIMEAFDDIHPETPLRDVIFDILMERFDLANKDKPALRSILDSFKTDPAQGIHSLAHLAGAMTRMLEVAGVHPYGWRGAARVAGLTATVAWITRVWIEDDTRDLSKTMAALDKSLSRIENFADRFNL